MHGIKERFRRWKLQRKSPDDIFTRYWRVNKWGDRDSRSGKGSNLAATQALRERLPDFIAHLGIEGFLDLPCGDCFWISQVDLGVGHYTGGDIVAPLIEENRRRHARPGVSFEVIDLIKGPIPRHDLIFTRDCLVHLSTPHLMAAIRNMKASGSTWLLTTTYPGRGANEEIETGQWRALDLTRPPFDFPPPSAVLPEGQEHVRGQGLAKSLGLWRISDLPDYPSRDEAPE